jgi:hypothetical protein
VGRRICLTLAASVLLLAACGSGTSAPAPLPADALPGEAGDATELDTGSIAGEAEDFGELEALLQDVGFEGGTERKFGQSQGARQQRALARVLAFQDAAGAHAYLVWLEDHVDELIGTAELIDPPGVPGAGFLALSEPGDCCPKATNVYLAAWAKGSSVLTLEVGGDGVRPAEVRELATTFDGSVSS